MMSGSSRLKIIAIGYNNAGTGLTRVMNSIMSRLAGRHEIHYLGIGYSGEIVRDRGLTIYPTNPKGGDAFAAFQAKRLIEEIRPSLVFILHDLWMFEYYLGILGPYRDRLKIICYIPIDGNIKNETAAEALSQADCVAVYTEWARNEFQRAFSELKKKPGFAAFPPVEVIPHGIDRERFYPFPELVAASFESAGRTGAKQKVFTSFSNVEDSFVVLNASRPDKRKRIDLTLEGFAIFARDKDPSVRLCLHHAIMGQVERDEIESLIRRLGLNQRVFLNPFGERVVSDQELNLLYNACDVGINTSMGEGWGLVNFEHGATGAAQIVPDHSACSELWRDHGELIPIERSYTPEFSVLELGEVAPEGVAQALDNLYRNPQRRQELSMAAVEMSRDPAYSWDSIAQRFEDLFLNTIEP